MLDAVVARFREQKRLADAAIAQLDEAQLRRVLHAGTNSIAVIMKHLGGNLLSRWTDPFTTDGEKPGRDREREFVDDFPTRTAIVEHWERGWARLMETLATLTPADLPRTVVIRGHGLTLADALVRALDHNAYHIGQIVLLAKVLAGEGWRTLSIAPGDSEEYNRRTWGPIGGPPR